MQDGEFFQSDFTGENGGFFEKNWTGINNLVRFKWAEATWKGHNAVKPKNIFFFKVQNNFSLFTIPMHRKKIMDMHFVYVRWGLD